MTEFSVPPKLKGMVAEQKHVRSASNQIQTYV